MTTPFRYNVGDKVFRKRNAQFFFNRYHYASHIASCIDQVKYANERRFSCSHEDLDWPAGMHLYAINMQEDGRPLFSNEHLLHIEKDKATIAALIEDEYKNAKAKLANKEANEMMQLTATIEHATARLKTLQAEGLASERQLLETMRTLAEDAVKRASE